MPFFPLLSGEQGPLFTDGTSPSAALKIFSSLGRMLMKVSAAGCYFRDTCVSRDWILRGWGVLILRGGETASECDAERCTDGGEGQRQKYFNCNGRSHSVVLSQTDGSWIRSRRCVSGWVRGPWTRDEPLHYPTPTTPTTHTHTHTPWVEHLHSA